MEAGLLGSVLVADTSTQRGHFGRIYALEDVLCDEVICGVLPDGGSVVQTEDSASQVLSNIVIPAKTTFDGYFRSVKLGSGTAVLYRSKPAEQVDIVSAFIADWGNAANGTAMADVATRVKSWNPEYIVSGGDNIYSPLASFAHVTTQYGSYVAERFYSAIQNHDYDEPAGGIDDYFDFFVQNQGQMYYTFQRGSIQWFMLNTEPMSERPDNTGDPESMEEGPQGIWLRQQLLQSTALWKIVVSGNPPYSSTTRVLNQGGRAYMRLPYAAWGANAVMSGDAHGYERCIVDNFPYFVGGWSGTGLIGFGNPGMATGSRVRYSTKNGAIKITSRRGDIDQLLFEAITHDGTTVDTWTIDSYV
jgi:hypothetical protein